MISAGIDIGVYAVKVVLLSDNKPIAKCAQPCGKNSADSVVKIVFNGALVEAGVSPKDVNFTVATGTECRDISYIDEFASHAMCLAKGCYEICKSISTIIDIGMLKTLVVRTKAGIPIKVASNANCAACSGIYLDVVSKSLEIEREKMAEISLKSKEAAEVTSTCAVFAESEIISLIHMKKRVEDILMGAFIALARRTHPLLLSVKFEKDIAMVGGVANNMGIVRAMEQQLESPITVPESPEMIAALGAAVLGQERV